jgi:outer membrane protein OmpA-like peptidoglycan-associated protein
MGSLLDSIKNSISPDQIRSIAASAGESPDGVKKGVETAAATMLATLAGKVNDTGFMSQIMSLISSYGTQTLGAAAGAGGAATAAASEAGTNFVSTLFGSNKAAIEGKIAQSAGLSSGTGATLLATAAPLVLGTLASKLSGGVTGLASALTSELPSLRGLVPAGLPGVHLPDLSSAASAPKAVAAEKATGGWLWPVLLLGALLIACLVWYFNRGTADVTKPVENAAAATQTAAADAGNAISDATKAAWAKLGDLFKRKLADGTELSIPRLGVENKLVDWIESSKPVDKETWFDFDRLLFATGSATLEPASQEQLSNVAAILKAYPKVKIKLGGYTDNTGDPAANLKLSDDRAKNVMAELVKLGVDPSRMEAQGYGEDHPVGDNKTEEGRQLNRRISLRVTEK